METNLHPFELRRLFIGEAPPFYLLEVLFRATVLYLVALLLLRLMNKRGLGQLSAFEWVIVIALGSAIGDPMFYPQVPILYAVIILSVVIILHRIISHLIRTHKKFKQFIEGTPRLMIKNGQILQKSLKEENLSEEDLLMQLRQQGIKHTNQVELAYLEVSGKLSVFQFERLQQKIKGVSTLPEEK